MSSQINLNPADHAIESATIRARDIMTADPVCLSPNATIHEAAVLLQENHVSAIPVIDHGQVVGLISEGDLLHREELGTATPDSDGTIQGRLHVQNPKSRREHGSYVRDVMTRKVVSVSESAPLPEIVRTLDANHIKRVLVKRDERLIGIVSRADIVRTLAARPAGKMPASADDDMIRFRAIEALLSMPGTSPWLTTVFVSHGVVRLNGTVENEAAREPSRVAIERLPYVVKVEDHRGILQPY